MHYFLIIKFIQLLHQNKNNTIYSTPSSVSINPFSTISTIKPESQDNIHTTTTNTPLFHSTSSPTQNELPLFLPGNSKVYVKTWGCSHNTSDSEYMAGLLAEKGYIVTSDEKEKHESDIWLLNSCTVKGPSETTFLNDIKKGQGDGKKVVLAGCVPQGSKNQGWNGLSVVGVSKSSFF